MSNNTGKTINDATAAYTNWQTGVTDSFRDLLGIQLRTAQNVIDKTMGLGQAWTDYIQTQVNEGVKLSQQCMKYGMSVSENLKKTATEVTDRTFHTPTT